MCLVGGIDLALRKLCLREIGPEHRALRHCRVWRQQIAGPKKDRLGLRVLPAPEQNTALQNPRFGGIRSCVRDASEQLQCLVGLRASRQGLGKPDLRRRVARLYLQGVIELCRSLRRLTEGTQCVAASNGASWLLQFQLSAIDQLQKLAGLPQSQMNLCRELRASSRVCAIVNRHAAAPAAPSAYRRASTADSQAACALAHVPVASSIHCADRSPRR